MAMYGLELLSTFFFFNRRFLSLFFFSFELQIIRIIKKRYL